MQRGILLWLNKKNIEERIEYFIHRKKSIEKKIDKLTTQENNIITNNSNSKIKELNQ